MGNKFEMQLAAVRPKVLALARKFFRASRLVSDPEDVAQEVLLRLWEARQAGADIRNVEAWAVSATKNCCVSLWRKAEKQRTMPLYDEGIAVALAEPGVEMSEAEAALEKALARLPAGTRYLLQLRAKGLSLDEMAAVTGRPKGSVKSSISAARKELLKSLNSK